MTAEELYLSDALKVSDTIHIKGHTSDFTQQIDSIQIEHTNVAQAEAGDVIGLKFGQKVHPHDKVYKVTP